MRRYVWENTGRIEYIDIDIYNKYRYVMSEKYNETYDYFAGFIFKKWTFTYSDGGVETVTTKERIQ